MSVVVVVVDVVVVVVFFCVACGCSWVLCFAREMGAKGVAK